MIDGRWRSALIEVKTPTVSWPSLAALVLNQIDLCNKWNIKLFVHKLSLDSLSRGQLSSIRATARGKAICNDLQWPAMVQGVPTSLLGPKLAGVLETKSIRSENIMVVPRNQAVCSCLL